MLKESSFFVPKENNVSLDRKQTDTFENSIQKLDEIIKKKKSFEEKATECLFELKNIEQTNLNYVQKRKIVEIIVTLLDRTHPKEDLFVRLIFELGQVLAGNFYDICQEDFSRYVKHSTLYLNGLFNDKCDYRVQLDKKKWADENLASSEYTKLDPIKKDRIELFSIMLIRNLRNILSCSRWETISWEPFIPENELKKILKLNRKEKDQKTARVLRREQFKKIQKEIYAQNIGISQIITSIETELKKNPDLEEEKIKDLVYARAEQYRLSSGQIALFEEKIYEYIKRHKIIANLRAKFPEDEELFHEIFGIHPKGKIEIITMPMTFSIVCYDKVDYSRLWNQKTDLSDSDIEKSSKSGGFFISDMNEGDLRGLLIFNNASIYNFHNKSVDVHEEQHAIFDFFTQDDYFQKSFLLNGAKNEILAYFKEGKDSDQIFQTLVNSELYSKIYDEFKKWKKNNIRKQGQEKNFDEKRCREEYETSLKKALESLNTLSKMGFSRTDIIYLLIDKPLKTWPKVVKRFFQRKKF